MIVLHFNSKPTASRNDGLGSRHHSVIWTSYCVRKPGGNPATLELWGSNTTHTLYLTSSKTVQSFTKSYTYSFVCFFMNKSGSYVIISSKQTTACWVCMCTAVSQRDLFCSSALEPAARSLEIDLFLFHFAEGFADLRECKLWYRHRVKA